jgi:hypothetical protein
MKADNMTKYTNLYTEIRSIVNPVTEEVVHDKCGTPECCGQCDTADVTEAKITVHFKKDKFSDKESYADEKTAKKSIKILKDEGFEITKIVGMKEDIDAPESDATEAVFESFKTYLDRVK